MLSIKDTIQRLGKTARQIELLNVNLPLKTEQKSPKSHLPHTKTIINRPNINLKQKKINQYRPILNNYQTQRYREFLEPLNMENLKVFNNDLPKFDKATSTKNWKMKNDNSSNLMKTQYNNFLLDRILFEKMMDLLIKITPASLKFVNGSKTLSHILRQHEEDEMSTKFNINTNEFHELPKLPDPLTRDNFQKYIYQLTHSTYYYQNSSSLTSGIIPDILLYTHKLTNEQFRPYRSVHTFNYLIRYFGYSKNQSSFARELLLVMNKDQQKPNIDTINTLLKTCQLHSHIRSIANTYQLIIKYLRLCQSLDIEINLTTYARIYDCIQNIFLRESFLNKIQEIELPIPRNLLLRIIDDFASTTKNTGELIEFITNDLARPHWNEENSISAKVVYHRGLHVQSNQDILNLSTFIKTRLHNVDVYTLKSLLESIRKNNILQNKFYVMMQLYSQNNVSVDHNTRIYQFLINQFLQECTDDPRENLFQAAFILRGLFHEMTTKLGLPQEQVRYSNNRTSLYENYSIIKRILERNECAKIDTIDARLDYTKATQLYQPFNTWEVDAWQSLLDKLKNQPLQALPIQEIYAMVNLNSNKRVEVAPPAAVEQYQKLVEAKKKHSSNRNRVHKVEQGIDEYTVSQMKERNLI